MMGRDEGQFCGIGIGELGMPSDISQITNDTDEMMIAQIAELPVASEVLL